MFTLHHKSTILNEPQRHRGCGSRIKLIKRGKFSDIQVRKKTVMIPEAVGYSKS